MDNAWVRSLAEAGLAFGLQQAAPLSIEMIRWAMEGGVLRRAADALLGEEASPVVSWEDLLRPAAVLQADDAGSWLTAQDAPRLLRLVAGAAADPDEVSVARSVVLLARLVRDLGDDGLRAVEAAGDDGERGPSPAVKEAALDAGPAPTEAMTRAMLRSAAPRKARGGFLRRKRDDDPVQPPPPKRAAALPINWVNADEDTDDDEDENNPQHLAPSSAPTLAAAAADIWARPHAWWEAVEGRNGVERRRLAEELVAPLTTGVPKPGAAGLVTGGETTAGPQTAWGRAAAVGAAALTELLCSGPEAAVPLMWEAIVGCAAATLSPGGYRNLPSYPLL